MASNTSRLFVTSDGKNVLFTFVLVSSLFVLWDLCNGLIDVMDKHFQDELHLSRAQSAFVGFLAGVCPIATGVTFLETLANPYTTVLGERRSAATRINLAQSCSGIGDRFDMSRGFIVPAFCFVFVAFYGFSWPKRIKAEREIVPVPSPAYTLARVQSEPE